MTADEQLWCYNGLDVCVTAEVRENLLPHLDETSRTTYDFSLALQAPVLEMAMRGLLVNQRKKHTVLRDMRAKLARLEEQLLSIIKDGVGVEGNFNWRSPTQLGKLLYDVMGLPIQKKRNTKGAYTRSTNRDAIETLSNYFIAEPLCAHLLALRDLGKSIGFLETGIDSDGRMRTSINIAGTNTGRLASSASDFGTGCVRPSAQALTPKGWRPLSELKDGDCIAQYNAGILEFVPAKFYWTDFDGELMFYNTEQIALAVTPDHRVLSKDYQGIVTTLSARDTFFKYAQRQIPIAGKFISGTKPVPSYLAMLMADCSKEGTVWRGSWKKDRKITRALQLLHAAGIKYNLGSDSRGYARLTIYADTNLPKKYGPWILDLTLESAKALVDEAKFWDAHIRGTSFIFYTADAKEAEWFQTLCHLVGYGTTLRWTKNSKEAYGNQSVIYSVNVKPRDHAQVLRKHWSPVRYSGKVGCPQVPSTYWLVRENGHISVTGNTNLQNVTSALRSIFVADPGYKLANLDLEQADSRNVGALCWNTFVESEGEAFAGRYLDACEGGDLHTTVCKMSSPQLFKDRPGGWTDRQVADQKAYRAKTYRDMAKVLGHGSNYLGQPATMAKHSKLPVPLVRDFQSSYFSAFPVIPAWHGTIFQSLENHGQLTTPFSRRRFFFGRPKEAATRREAVAYQPQSMTADEINYGMLNIWRNNPYGIQLLIQVHDSILFQYPEELEDEVIPWALEALRTKLILAKDREFIVPTEAQVGWNWGYHDKESNPDGLVKWRGHDDRSREELEFKLSFRSL